MLGDSEGEGLGYNLSSDSDDDLYGMEEQLCKEEMRKAMLIEQIMDEDTDQALGENDRAATLKMLRKRNDREERGLRKEKLKLPTEEQIKMLEDLGGPSVERIKKT
jgi:hypothetical protein